MLTENGMQLDENALRQVLQHADVLTIGFTTFPERLLVDTRFSDDEGPLVTLVDPVANLQERYLWLGRERGRFGAPQNFSFFVWPHTVRWMIERDALAPLRARLATVSDEAPLALDRALEQLRQLEYQAMRAAIAGGEGWHTVWAAA